MKSKSKNPLHYSASRDDEDEVVEVPDLPNIALPIGQKPMPTFSFGNLQSKPTTAVASSPASGGATNGGSSHTPGPLFGQGKTPTTVMSLSREPWKQGGKTSTFADGTVVPPKSSSTDSVSGGTPLMTSTPFTGNTPVSQFKFTPGNQKPIDGVGVDFTFSEPVVKVSTVGSDALPTAADDEEFTFSIPNQKDTRGTHGGKVASPSAKPSPSKDQNKDSVEDDSSGGIKVAKSLRSGSCLQILGIGSSNPVTKPEAQKNMAKSSSSLFNKVKPDEGSSKPVSNSKDSLQSSSGFSLMDKFRPQAGSWECETCLVRNGPNVVKCAACESAKPGAEPAKDDVTVPLSENFKPPKGVSDSQPEISSSATGGMSLSEMFKPPEGSWTCDTCLIQNQATDSKCLACQSSKPGASSTKPQTTGVSIEGGAFKLSAPLSFGSKSTEVSKSDASAKPSLSEMFKPEEGSWECDTCMVRNKSSCGRCVACETPKPGSEAPLSAPPASSFKFGSSSTSSSSSSATSSHGFKIAGGIPSLSSSSFSGTTLGNGGFTFGTGGNTPKDSSAPGAGFKVPGGISFGSFTNTSKEQLSKATSSDSVSSSAGFSVESVSDKGVSGGFQPSRSSEGGAKVADSSAILSGGFKFGETSEESKAKKSTTFTFGASSTTDETDKILPVGASSLSGPGDLKGTEQSVRKTATGTVSDSGGPALQFGLKPNETSQSSSTSSSNSQATPNVNPFQSSLASAGSKSSFTFGAAPSVSESEPPSASSIANHPPATKESSGSSFLVTTTAPPPAKSNTFQFGPSLTKTSESASILGKRKESEPSSTSTDKDAAFKPSFNFTGGTLAGPSVTFGRLPGSTQEQQTPSMTFGASNPPASNPQTNTSTFQFGVQSKTEAPAAQSSSLFAFGAKPQQSQVPASNASGFQFGTVSSSSQNSQQPEKKPFTFGAPATSSSSTGSFTASNSFTGFDSAGSMPTNSAVPSFGGATGGFGSNAASANSAFGAPSRQQNSTPVFGQSTPQQNSFGATTKAAQSLGSGNAAPAFGASVPAFGSNSQPNANSTGFSAGMETPAFQFGQNNNNNPSTGTFAFGAGANQATNTTTQGGFSFNASQPPVFNFGAAAPASNQAPFQFNAAPSTEVNPFNASAPPSGRKFKKAVRRTGRKT